MTSHNRQFTQQTIANTHLSIYASISQPLASNKQTCFDTEMENTNTDQNNPTTNSPPPKKLFSLTSYLSVKLKSSATRADKKIPKLLEDVFNAKLIAAMIN